MQSAVWLKYFDALKRLVIAPFESMMHQPKLVVWAVPVEDPAGRFKPVRFRSDKTMTGWLAAGWLAGWGDYISEKCRGRERWEGG